MTRAGKSGSKRKKRANGGTRPRRAKLLRLGVLGSLAVSALVLLSYFFIDQKVAKALVLRQGNSVSAIYSDAQRVALNSSWSPEQLEARLLRARYRKVGLPLSEPGTYSRTKVAIEFITRQFNDGHGNISEPTHIHFPIEERRFEILSESAAGHFYFEPEVVSNLGSGELRAAEYTHLHNIPAILQQAVLAIEDARFFEHSGLDFIGIGRAMIRNIQALRIVEGGSTITQQLAKNLLFQPERTIGRKLLEVLAAVSIERRLTKNEILEFYLNEVYLGQEGAVALHGVGQAAKAFFGKSVTEISLSEAALLAGIIKAPSFYSPRRHFKRALQRSKIVMQEMEELGFISAQQISAAKQVKLNIIDEPHHRRLAPFYIVALEKELSKYIHLEAAISSGLAVQTGLDLDLQECAERAVSEGAIRLEERFPSKTNRLEVSLVALEPFSGKVRAWVGGRDYALNQFDHVSQAKRQIGSTIKPFLYLTALDPRHPNFMTAATILQDEPLKVEQPRQPVWVPQNYDRKHRGNVTLRYALENSLNIPAARAALAVGLPAVAQTIRNFHISDDVSAVPALALGALDTTLLNLTAAYAALANGGIYVMPRLFVTAQDYSGEALLNSEIQEQLLADEATVYVLTNLLQGVIERGTGRSIRAHGFLLPAAGKTGTSDDARDAWFAGFTPELAVGVWIGYDDNAKLAFAAAQSAAPIWAEFMKCTSRVKEFSSFIPPRNVRLADLDLISLEAATDRCPQSSVVREVFVRGTEPTTSCHLHPGSRLEMTEEPGTRKKRKKSFWERLFG